MASSSSSNQSTAVTASTSAADSATAILSAITEEAFDTDVVLYNDDDDAASDVENSRQAPFQREDSFARIHGDNNSTSVQQRGGPEVDVYEDLEDDDDTANVYNSTQADTDMAVASAQYYPRWAGDENLGREQPPQPTTTMEEEGENDVPMPLKIKRDSKPPPIVFDAKKVAPTQPKYQHESTKPQRKPPPESAIIANSNKDGDEIPIIQKDFEKVLRRRRGKKRRRLALNLAIFLVILSILVVVLVVGIILGLQRRNLSKNNNNGNGTSSSSNTGGIDNETVAPSKNEFSLPPSDIMESSAPSTDVPSTILGTTVPPFTEAPSNIVSIETFEPLPPTASPSASTLPPIALPTKSPSLAPTACIPVTKAFPDSTRIAILLQVSPTISPMEMEYAANVFRKTFNSLAICDSHCRTLETVQVANHTIMESTFLTPPQEENPKCDAVLELTLSLDGTYRGCEGQEDQDFPGMFETVTPDKNERSRWLRRNGRERKRQLQQQAICPFADPGVSTCPPATGTTADQTIRMMSQFVSMLPQVCQIDAAHDVPKNNNL